MSKSTNKKKGDIAEDLVAQLHNAPGVSVSVRRKIPVLTSTIGAKREIDVLLESDIAGIPVRVVIEVKNEAEPAGTAYIDELDGKLNDIGLHNSCAIFVSASGFTGPALEKARQLGIRTYKLDGLTEDRLNVAVDEAVQSQVFLLATWRDLNFFSFLSGQQTPSNDQFIVTELPADAPHGRSTLLNHLWHLWVQGTIPYEIGEHTVFIKAPPDWSYTIKENNNAASIIATIDVTGHVATLSGTVSNVRLTNVESEAIEKFQETYKFPESPILKLDPMLTGEELDTYIKGRARQSLVVHRIPVPRILDQLTFWPPTQEAMKRVKEMVENGETPSFDKVEGLNLARAWEIFSNKY